MDRAVTFSSPDGLLQEPPLYCSSSDLRHLSEGTRVSAKLRDCYGDGVMMEKSSAPRRRVREEFLDLSRCSVVCHVLVLRTQSDR